ncbi:helix-turn-helix domain-containing protein [Thalassospira povalilytica]|uniref:helix-turn-helix domain-containing protein n=1 Tax=Thalassospira povalilytica TaxID=732237 RepID=UPI001D18AD96|nr:helix-turn-helix transcriptional regulator [Thalassospira povalilytica]MCC4240350.1 helix-turn-helix transcriptional regulator [Thalassospira povalilytica]
MKLSQYLDNDHKGTRAEFSSLIGVTPMALHRYENGDRTPRKDVMAKIHEVTGGKVGPADFYDLVA